MALINCPECGKADVSDKAEKCPNCGYSLRESLQRPIELEPLKKWRISDGTLGFLVVLGLILLIVEGNAIFSDPEQPKTSEQLRKEEIEKHFSAWDGSHIGLTRHIKEHMNDPGSYEHIETRFTDQGYHILVVTKYRGANAFGGKVINTVTAKVDFTGRVLEIANTYGLFEREH